ncbi:hypothetical protein [Tenacibaculum halocynthiae]|uniref:hypothetical protein n=1 Tax=Tenacibaculum halocynthiae TaxID=1254437 RepID=UPI003D65B843
MKKSILNLGNALNKIEQKQINGGRKFCTSHAQCPANQCCQSPPTSSSGICGAANNGQGLCNGQLPFEDVPFGEIPMF